MDRIEELSDTRIVVRVPVIEVTEDTDVKITVMVGDCVKTFEQTYSYVYVPFTWMWISGSFNGWSTDHAMEKDPVDPFTFHVTTDIIQNKLDDGGENAFKFLTKSIAWAWGRTYNAAQAKAPITDTRVVFQENAAEANQDWKWEFQPWQCGYAYKITLCIKPGEEKMTCTPIGGTPEAPKEYTAVSTLNTDVPLSNFRAMQVTSDGKLLAVVDWDKIYKIDPVTGKADVLFCVDWQWESGGPRELNGMALSKDEKTIYLACPSHDVFYLSESSDFTVAVPVVQGVKTYCSSIAVNPSDDTIIFNDEGETFYRLDNLEGENVALSGYNAFGSNGASRIFFAPDGKTMYRLLYQANGVWDDLGAVYAYDYDAATKTLANEKLIAGSDTEFGYTDGTGAEARFHRPYGGIADENGNIYVADDKNHCIRKITVDGVVTTFAGANEAGNADGSLTEARFTKPVSMAVAKDGTIYVGQNGDGTNPAGIRIIK